MAKISVTLLRVATLKPHEKIGLKHYRDLLHDIQKDKAIYSPIIVDLKSNVILDGHHRFSVAKKLKLKKIPCVVVDYFNDEIITVFPRRKNIPISKELIVQAGLSGKLFPNKTTRHVLHGTYSSTMYHLNLLQED